MNLYIDESGSINNHIPNNKYFIIAIVNATNKDALKRAYKRFVSSNHDRLFELDQDRTDNNGKVIEVGGKMFSGESFKELKGSQFDRDMKIKFIDFFTRKQSFELFYIRIENSKLTDSFCSNTARVFNYSIKLALDYFITHGYLPNEDCFLQLDERNEKTETKYFLENYLNTELFMKGTATGHFTVSYFDSANNSIIQIADVLSNFFYSELQTNAYSAELKKLKDSGILKFVFDFPM